MERERRKIDNDPLPPRLMGLARAQRGLCYHCGASLFNGEALHRHHLLPKSEGGTDKHSNLRLLHLYCHQQIHAPSTGKKTFRCESELLEPCARKPARTVLRGEWRSDAPFLPD